ncbi:MAG: pyridoxamine kinase [Treponema sp.]|nr:pyridoxamine kinase [Treponema sp.]
MNRVVTFQDISCIGKCSLTVALPLISAMGIECSVLPTAVLSTHTAFEGFTFHDLTSELQKTADHWKQNQIHFDAILTGYLGSINQIDIVSKFIDDFGDKGALAIIDPCMADNGKLYTGFTPDFVKHMAKLCGKANFITPNLTEAHLLLNLPYNNSEYDEDYIKNIAVRLSGLGAQKVILKGIGFSEEQKSVKGTKEKIGILCYDSLSEKFSWYFHKKMPQNFHGTGDIFASVLTGGIMRGLPLENAASLAADFVAASIKETLSHPDYNWYGVDFETCIPYLLKRLELTMGH